MTPIEKFLHWLLVLNVWQVVKGCILLGLVFYLMFAIVMVRQIQLMCETVNTGMDWLIKLIGWVHLGLTIGIILLVVVVA